MGVVVLDYANSPGHFFNMKNYRDLNYIELEAQRYRAELTRRISKLRAEIVSLQLIIEDIDNEYKKK